MKYIKVFEAFSRKQNIIDEILDKISSSGIDSLSDYERKLIDNGGVEDKLDEETLLLTDRIMTSINKGMFISVDYKNIDTFLDIMERNNINIERDINWPTKGSIYFCVKDRKLIYEFKQPEGQEIHFPSFPEQESSSDDDSGYHFN